MSTTTLDQDKADLIAKAIDLAVAGKGSGGPPHDRVGALLKAYYRHVAPEDVCDRSDADLYGALASHWHLAGSRPQGTAQVRVFTPSLGEHGWSAGGHSVVEVVTDDMPFLVDSLTMELSRQLRDVHVVIHPHLDVVRDNYTAFAKALPDTRVFYAVKANPAPEVLKLLASLGSCFDIASLPEIVRQVAQLAAQRRRGVRRPPLDRRGPRDGHDVVRPGAGLRQPDLEAARPGPADVPEPGGDDHGEGRKSLARERPEELLTL